MERAVGLIWGVDTSQRSMVVSNVHSRIVLVFIIFNTSGRQPWRNSSIFGFVSTPPEDIPPLPTGVMSPEGSSGFEDLAA